MVRVEPIKFLYAGLVYLVSFIALFGFLAEANHAIKIIWEIAYLIIGLFILRAVYTRKTMFGASATFYAVNLILLIIAKVLIEGTALNIMFFVFGIILMAGGFVFSILQMKGKEKQIVPEPEMEIPVVPEVPKVEITEIPEIKVEEKPKVVKKAKKKAKKKTTKKKAKKKAKK